MEKEMFHEHLSALKSYFGEDANLIPITKVAKYCKLDYRTMLADRTLPMKRIGRRYYVPLIGLARWLS